MERDKNKYLEYLISEYLLSFDNKFTFEEKKYLDQNPYLILQYFSELDKRINNNDSNLFSFTKRETKCIRKIIRYYCKSEDKEYLVNPLMVNFSNYVYQDLTFKLKNIIFSARDDVEFLDNSVDFFESKSVIKRNSLSQLFMDKIGSLIFELLDNISFCREMMNNGNILDLPLMNYKNGFEIIDEISSKFYFIDKSKEITVDDLKALDYFDAKTIDSMDIILNTNSNLQDDLKTGIYNSIIVRIKDLLFSLLNIMSYVNKSDEKLSSMDLDNVIDLLDKAFLTLSGCQFVSVSQVQVK